MCAVGIKCASSIGVGERAAVCLVTVDGSSDRTVSASNPRLDLQVCVGGLPFVDRMVFG